MQPKAPWFRAKKAAPAKIPKRINPMSARQRERRTVYMKVRKSFLKEHPICQARFVDCTGKSTQIHHMYGRHGSNYTDPKTFIAVCMKCHEFIHRNPERAFKAGVMGSFLK